MVTVVDHRLIECLVGYLRFRGPREVVVVRLAIGHDRAIASLVIGNGPYGLIDIDGPDEGDIGEFGEPGDAGRDFAIELLHKAGWGPRRA